MKNFIIEILLLTIVTAIVLGGMFGYQKSQAQDIDDALNNRLVGNILPSIPALIEYSNASLIGTPIGASIRLPSISAEASANKLSSGIPSFTIFRWIWASVGL